MRRMPLVLSMLGLVWAAALPARAQQKTVKLFGRTYNVDCASRAQTYKNGLKVVLPASGNQKANLFFAEGADPSQDRLFVAAPINGTDDPLPTAHQLYVLTGADANGSFSPTSATLTEFFGGNVDYTKGGRPDMVMLISDANTGVKVDRNIAVHTLADTDAYRYYDLDSLSTNYVDDSLFNILDRQISGDDGNPHAPRGAFGGFAPGPNGTIVTFGRSDAAGVEIGVTDPKQNDYFDVLTKLHEVTANTPTPISEEVHATSVARVAENEYWLVVSTGAPDADNDSTDSNKIYRLRLTFPTDLAKAAPGSIKVEVLGVSEELIGTPLHASPGGVFGIAAGREVAPGLRRLYFADWQGNLCVATPVP
jgi:hypothetical protein